jgi:outer membrane protein OmpA-like peptidoglycan-associated protein
MRSILIGCFSLVAVASAHAACDDIKSQSFDAARASRFDDAIGLIKQMDAEATCSAAVITSAKFALASYFVQKAVEVGDAKPFNPKYVELIQKADTLGAFWQASARLGDVQAASRRFGDAAGSYQKAINLLEVSLKPVTGPERKYIVQRAEETRQLAAEKGNGGESRALFVALQPNHRGGTGGEYGEAAGRGITGEKVPTPIVFEYNSDQFTPEGAQYAAELLAVLQKVTPGHITIYGHTDQRGPDDYNMALSDRRAKAVAAYLYQGGIKAQFQIVPKGEREPRALADPSAYTPDEIDALNRRVEASWGP